LSCEAFQWPRFPINLRARARRGRSCTTGNGPQRAGQGVFQLGALLRCPRHPPRFVRTEPARMLRCSPRPAPFPNPNVRRHPISGSSPRWPPRPFAGRIIERTTPLGGLVPCTWRTVFPTSPRAGRSKWRWPNCRRWPREPSLPRFAPSAESPLGGAVFRSRSSNPSSTSTPSLSNPVERERPDGGR
jgi:hypothetical protein